MQEEIGECTIDGRYDVVAYTSGGRTFILDPKTGTFKEHRMSHAKHYHIVQNTPGYVPENDVYCVDGRRAAIQAVSEEIRRCTESIAWEGEHYSYCRPSCKRQHPTYRVSRSADRLRASIEDRSKTYDLGYVISADAMDECNTEPNGDGF